MAQKPATLKDVAAYANVSRATAARALNSYGYVGDETARKVHEAAEKLGYRGNRLVQVLRNGQLSRCYLETMLPQEIGRLISKGRTRIYHGRGLESQTVELKRMPCYGRWPPPYPSWGGAVPRVSTP
jgi:regulatory LacI family protein